MPDNSKLFGYTRFEENLNIWTHGFGFLASVVALVFLFFRESENTQTRVSLTIFGLSMCILYLASTVYHSATEPKKRNRLNIFDHSAIYVLIAGTYTPLTLVTLEGSQGWWLFGITWSIAIVGIILKLFFIGRFDILSTILYVAMGWIIVFVYSELIDKLHPAGVQWLFAGGISYTIGAVLYSISKIPMNHAIFHLFVLGGTFCHFMMIYFYVGT